MKTSEKFRVAVEDANSVRAQMAKGPTPHHSPEIQRMLDRPLVTIDEIAAMSPEDRAEAQKRGLIGSKSPIEVWLTKANIGITCRVVHEDESTEELQVDSLSMRGAQREMTGYFKRLGYEPAGRWETEHAGEADDSEETFRRFH